MAINVSVVEHGSESSMSLVRRFSKRVLGAGIVRRVKGNRYKLRMQSKSKRAPRPCVALQNAPKLKKWSAWVLLSLAKDAAPSDSKKMRIGRFEIVFIPRGDKQVVKEHNRDTGERTHIGTCDTIEEALALARLHEGMPVKE